MPPGHGRSVDATTLCATLLRELKRLPGDFWIRPALHSPGALTDGFVSQRSRMSEGARVLTGPCTHSRGHAGTHAARTPQQYIVDLVAKIRSGRSGHRTAYDVHRRFPGETEPLIFKRCWILWIPTLSSIAWWCYLFAGGGTRAGQMEGPASPDKPQRQRATSHGRAPEGARQGRSRSLGVNSSADRRAKPAPRSCRRPISVPGSMALIAASTSMPPTQGPLLVGRVKPCA